MTLIDYQITTVEDSLRLENVDNILVDMIMIHNDLDPGTLVSEIDVPNLTVKVNQSYQIMFFYQIQLLINY